MRVFFLFFCWNVGSLVVVADGTFLLEPFIFPCDGVCDVSANFRLTSYLGVDFVLNILLLFFVRMKNTSVCTVYDINKIYNLILSKFCHCLQFTHI